MGKNHLSAVKPILFLDSRHDVQLSSSVSRFHCEIIASSNNKYMCWLLQEDNIFISEKLCLPKQNYTYNSSKKFQSFSKMF